MAFPAFKFCYNSFFTFWPNKIFSMVSFWSFLSQTFSVSLYFVYQITSKLFLLFFWPFSSFQSSSPYANYLFVPYKHFPSMPWVFSFSYMGFVLLPQCNIFLWISVSSSTFFITIYPKTVQIFRFFMIYTHIHTRKKENLPYFSWTCHYIQLLKHINIISLPSSFFFLCSFFLFLGTQLLALK